MKHIIINGFCLLLFPCLYAMEIVPLLSKKTPQEELNNYFKETLPRLKLFEIGEHYRNLPMECRGKVIQRMSHELLILHRVALYLPDEIQQQIFNNVKSVMFDGDSKAVNIFYQEQPMLEAFQLYHTIKKSIREGDSVACLYKMPHYRRNEILEKINPWYSSYSSPIITFQEQEKINKLNTKARQYFSGPNSTSKCITLVAK